MLLTKVLHGSQLVWIAVIAFTSWFKSEDSTVNFKNTAVPQMAKGGWLQKQWYKKKNQTMFHYIMLLSLLKNKIILIYK